MSGRATRRMALVASHAGEDVPVELPQRVPGSHYAPPVQRYLDPATEVEYLLCDGGFTELLAAAERVSAAQQRRRDELAT